MAFEKGNKLGSSPKKARLFEDMLFREMKHDDFKNLRKAAKQLLQLAAEGDLQAIVHLADRLDGKPAQTTNLNINREINDMGKEEILERLNTIRGRIASDAVFEDPGSKGPSSEVH